MNTKVCIDGVLHEESTAKISVFDRGFLYGDSVYEVMRTYNTRPFALDEHLTRLERSAELLFIPLPTDRETLDQEIRFTLAATGNPESYIRLIITRGAGAMGLDPNLAESPTRVIIVGPLALHPPELYRRGETIRLVPTGRSSAGALPKGAKSGNYLVNLMALGEAKRHGAGEAVLLDASGRVAEGASSNVFALVDGHLCTPPLSAGILEGITRHKVMALAHEAGLSVSQRHLTTEELRRADEIFLTSTVREVLPVTRVDDWAVGDGKPGPVAGRLHRAYLDAVEAEYSAR